MRSLPALIVLALPPCLLIAQDKSAETMLTPKEIVEGWILLFDGETTMGWEIEGEAKVDKGVLVLGGTKPTKAQVTSRLVSYEARAKLQIEGKQAARIRIGSEESSYTNSRESLRSKVAEGVRPVSPFELTIPAGTIVRIHHASVHPLGMTALFNGKDLTGWKVYQGDSKREKSKWTVTREGWLNVKSGPGDLQTEKTFDDFVLQLECLSNGKHLNSGIFFRCLPGQYQQGYEAQIRNQFLNHADSKYTVEVYDPKTNKLVEKKVVYSPAVDYGTGAIYRRIPARKAISKDGEWFTFTILAQGRHLATWVNGVQVVDWTDHRPAHENARTGYREKPGAISIQGHDPTTDLSFRNLRLAPLPR